MNKFGVITVISLMIFSSCSGGKMASTWTDESYEVEYFDKILIVGNSPNVSVRYAFEKELKEKIEKKGVTAISSLEVLPKEEKISKEAFDKYFSDADIDAVLVTRLVKLQETAEFVEGQTTYNQAEYKSSGYFYTFYHSVYIENTDPNYFQTERVYQIETSLFKVDGEKLVWHALSESYNPNDALEIIDDQAKNIAKKLSAGGYLKKK